MSTLPETIHDCGEILKLTEDNFTLVRNSRSANLGGGVLHILAIEPSCGCTVIDAKIEVGVPDFDRFRKLGVPVVEPEDTPRPELALVKLQDS